MVKIIFFVAIIAVAFAAASSLIIPSLPAEVPLRPVLRDVGGQTPANTIKGEYVNGKILTGYKYEYEPTVYTSYVAPPVSEWVSPVFPRFYGIY